MQAIVAIRIASTGRSERHARSRLRRATDSTTCAARLQTRGADLDADSSSSPRSTRDRRRLIPEVEGLKREQNAAGEEVARAKRQGHDAAALLEANKARGERIKQLDAELEAIEQQRTDACWCAAEPAARERAGGDERRGQRRSPHAAATPRAFDFTPKPHWDLGPALGILDFERGDARSPARASRC